MPKPSRLFFSMFLSAYCITCSASEKVISLYDQIVGPAWVTYELRVETNGDVIEENYNWNSKDFHSEVVIRRLSPEEMQTILAETKSRLENLPKYVDNDRSTTVDSEFRSITINSQVLRLKSVWDSYNDAPPTVENIAFQNVWKHLENILKGVTPNKTLQSPATQ